MVRFTRLGGDADETVDLDRCLLILAGPGAATDTRVFDLQRITYYYLTPEGRGILGLGGWRQAQFGGDGYREVHPMQIVHDRLLHGLKIPPELAKYRPFLKPELNLPESIAAWEKAVATGEGPEIDKTVRPCDRKALAQWKWALRQKSEFSQETADREVYDWLEEHWDEDKLPAFESWTRYLRAGRLQSGDSKRPKRLHPSGRSIVRKEET